MPALRPTLLLAGLLGLALAGTAAAQSTLRCESQRGEYVSCPVDTRGGVTLTRQYSREGCWQGDTWGYDRNRIWVTRGCRAEFRIGPESSGGNDGAKVAGLLVLGAIAAAAIASHNRDRDDDGYRDDGYYGGRELRCESDKGRWRSCGYIGRREHVEVRRQLSRADCNYGYSWGVDRGQLWVDHGCRAVFVVY